ncbi:glycosyltransferase family 39 protein [Parafrankia elaeagni]|uniref:glycosyltransferase family 39 protein n=1 Tax=Parafrankia elaeagni TaxID=222534 RepID=UPI001E43B64F|nr:glycosyltransferase family 39 protein [Parafrankia elaeagni]
MGTRETTTGTGRPGQPRLPGRRPSGTVAAALGAAALAVAVQAVFWQCFRQPLWYDELWRPHFAGEPMATFWSELSVANTPSALGSIALLRLCGEVFGWHAWSLRLPSAVPLLALAAATWLLARRLTGRGAAAGAVLAVTLAGTVVDLASQVKPYTLDAACAVAVVLVWMSDPPSTRGLLARRIAAGLLAVLSLPVLFLIVPLFVHDAARPLWAHRRQPGRRALRTAGRAAACAAPAVVVAGLHALLFVTHQSSQRASTFWDDHFLAGRGPLDAARFLLDQLAATAAGAPPGIDRYDPNLVHPLTDSSEALVVALGVAVTISFVAGAVTLGRRRDGRVLLVATAGAELMILAASAWRYWPFGAVRPNTFLVPLLTVVAAVGASTLACSVPARVRGMADPVVLVLVPVLLLTAAVPVAAATGLRPLWEERTDRRPIDLMVDATATARDLYRPGDLVLVGGRLARAGWLYGTRLSQDGAVSSGARSASARGAAGARRPRIPVSATVFLTAIGDGGVGQALDLRAPGPGSRVLLFVLAYDRRGTARALDEARAAGWCPAETHDFELTGTLRVLTRCSG